MSIYGVGADIVEVSRIKRLIKKKLLLKKLFNSKEIVKCLNLKNSSNCFAKRFAAKEAFSKALGTGISKGISFNEIIVLNEKKGKPYIKLLNKTKLTVKKKIKKRKYKISLSLSDEKKYAVAFVTISI
tara:strand:+ start:403 stop:786 length:384 start_codon:yes stop_codon:yes gene_type:complete